MKTRPELLANKTPLSAPLTEADLKLFKQLQVTPEQLTRARVRRVTHEQAKVFGFEVGKLKLDGILFEYVNAADQPVNGRIRRDAENEPRYVAMPGGSERVPYALTGEVNAFLADPMMEYLLVEAEKSKLAWQALAKRNGWNLLVLALGGSSGWSEEHELMAPLRALLAGRKGGLLFDADAATNHQVQKMEMALLLALRRLGSEVSVFRVPPQPGPKGAKAGPDDYLASHKDAECLALLAKPVEPWLASVGESYEAYENAKPPSYIIQDFMMAEGILFLPGLSGHGKTFVAFDTMRSCLTGEPLFGYFKVLDKVRRVVFLSPEITLSQFKKRAERYGLGPYVKSGQLVPRTLTKYPTIGLDDPALLLAAKDAVVVLDTAIRFVPGDENSSSDVRELGAQLFQFLGHGARAVICTHHSPKGFEKESFMSLENMMRGSGDFGSMSQGAWGIRKLPSDGLLIHLENLKQRDDIGISPFNVRLGEKGGLVMDAYPGEAKLLKDYLQERKEARGRKTDPDKAARSQLEREWLEQGKTTEQIMTLLIERKINIGDGTLAKELSKARKEIKEVKNRKF